MQRVKHCKKVLQLFNKLKKYGLKIKLKKYILFANEFEFLGKIINEKKLN